MYSSSFGGGFRGPGGQPIVNYSQMPLGPYVSGKSLNPLVWSRETLRQPTCTAVWSNRIIYNLNIKIIVNVVNETRKDKEEIKTEGFKEQHTFRHYCMKMKDASHLLSNFALLRCCLHGNGLVLVTSSSFLSVHYSSVISSLVAVNWSWLISGRYIVS